MEYGQPAVRREFILHFVPHLIVSLGLLAIGLEGKFVGNACAETPGTVRWQFKPNATGSWSGASIGPNGTVYVSHCQGSGGAVYALDGATGAKVWDYQSSCFASTPAIGNDGNIYVGGGDNRVYALDGTTGNSRWAFQGDAPFEASPAIGQDGTIYIGCNDHKFYALDGSSGAKRWDFATGGPIHEAAAVGTNGTIYFGSTDGSVYALSALTGTQLWRFPTGGPITCSPALAEDGTLYLGSNDHSVYALDGMTGAQRWKVLTAAPVDWSPAIADEMVVIGSNESSMYSLDLDNGGLCWSLPFIVPISRAHPVISADGILYFGATNLVAAIDHTTKYSIWTFTTQGFNNSSPTIGADGTVFVGSDNGPFYALWSSSAGGLANSPWPGAGQNIRHTGLVASYPTVLNQPVTQSVRAGASPLLSVIAVGATPLSFQWFFNGTALMRATNAALVLTNFQAAMSGEYAAVVSNSLGMVTSAVARVGFEAAPTITSQPEGRTAIAGDNVILSVAAVGSRPLAYQWQFNGANLAGASNSILTLTNVGPQQAGAYRAIVSNMMGSTTSLPANLIVRARPALSIEPGLVLTLEGLVGATYRIEQAQDLGPGNWTLLTNLTLSVSPVRLKDFNSSSASKAFYRAAIVP